VFENASTWLLLSIDTYSDREVTLLATFAVLVGSPVHSKEDHCGKNDEGSVEFKAGYQD